MDRDGKFTEIVRLQESGIALGGQFGDSLFGLAGLLLLLLLAREALAARLLVEAVAMRFARKSVTMTPTKMAATCVRVELSIAVKY